MRNSQERRIAFGHAACALRFTKTRYRSLCIPIRRPLLQRRATGRCEMAEIHFGNGAMEFVRQFAPSGSCLCHCQQVGRRSTRLTVSSRSPPARKHHGVNTALR